MASSSDVGCRRTVVLTIATLALVGASASVSWLVWGGGFDLDRAPSPARAPSSSEPQPLVNPEAAEQLEAAERLREQGEFTAAFTAYLDLIEAHPGSAEAYRARVSAGAIALHELERPGPAHRLFQRALEMASDGSLDEQARWGLAGALRELGDARGEASALEDFIVHHPTSPRASRAMLRLADAREEAASATR